MLQSADGNHQLEYWEGYEINPQNETGYYNCQMKISR